MQDRVIAIIKAAMEARGISATQLATSSGVHITLVHKYLNGTSRVGEKNARAIANALGLTVRQVLYGEGAAA